jgi:hypothetical protein
MMGLSAKWWLAAGSLLLLAPALLAEPHYDHKRRDCDPWEHAKCQKVPEGGSAGAYLLGAGAACLGAMFVRSRLAKPRLS